MPDWDILYTLDILLLDAVTRYLSVCLRANGLTDAPPSLS